MTIISGRSLHMVKQSRSKPTLDSEHVKNHYSLLPLHIRQADSEHSIGQGQKKQKKKGQVGAADAVDGDAAMMSQVQMDQMLDSL